MTTTTSKKIRISATAAVVAAGIFIEGCSMTNMSMPSFLHRKEVTPIAEATPVQNDPYAVEKAYKEGLNRGEQDAKSKVLDTCLKEVDRDYNATLDQKIQAVKDCAGLANQMQEDAIQSAAKYEPMDKPNPVTKSFSETNVQETKPTTTTTETYKESTTTTATSPLSKYEPATWPPKKHKRIRAKPTPTPAKVTKADDGIIHSDLKPVTVKKATPTKTPMPVEIE